MRIKILFQATILLIIIAILSFFYYQYLGDSKKILSKINKKDEIKIDELNQDIVNELVNVEYNSTDKNGNTFYLNAEKATVELEGTKNSNKVKLDKVVSVITLKNKGIIYIHSGKALYDKLNHDTFFFNDVNINYLNNSIFSENVDLIFSEKICTIYNNVSYKSERFNLYSDKILIDMLTGDIRLEMEKKSEKVNLTAKYEYIN